MATAPCGAHCRPLSSVGSNRSFACVCMATSVRRSAREHMRWPLSWNTACQGDCKRRGGTLQSAAALHTTSGLPQVGHIRIQAWLGKIQSTIHQFGLLSARCWFWFRPNLVDSGQSRVEFHQMFGFDRLWAWLGQLWALYCQTWADSGQIWAMLGQLWDQSWIGSGPNFPLNWASFVHASTKFRMVSANIRRISFKCRKPACFARPLSVDAFVR